MLVVLACLMSYQPYTNKQNRLYLVCLCDIFLIVLSNTDVFQKLLYHRATIHSSNQVLHNCRSATLDSDLAKTEEKINISWQ